MQTYPNALPIRIIERHGERSRTMTTVVCSPLDSARGDIGKTPQEVISEEVLIQVYGVRSSTCPNEKAGPLRPALLLIESAMIT